MEKNLENIKIIESINFDTLQILENFSKNFKFKMPKIPEGVIKYEWNGDSTYFNKEEFEQDMKELQEELNKSEFDQEGFKKDMEDLKEDLKDMQKDLKENLNYNNEELKKEMEKVKEEVKKAMKDG